MQLFINTRGSLLKRKGERFEIRASEQSHEFAAEKIHSIVVATSVRLTSNAIQLANEKNVDIVFLDSKGFPNSRVWQTRLGSTAMIRRKQLEASQSDEGLQIANAWVLMKLQNQSAFLLELKKRRAASQAMLEKASDGIKATHERLSSVAPIDNSQGTTMGHEGTAGRIYFDALSKIMPAEYAFSGRSRRPAVDPFNATLNYAYGVLYSQVERALILAGLDPFIGFLHTDNYNKPSLVYDLIEPFRIVAERTAVLLFTGRRAKKEFFRDVPGGMELAPDGRAALIESLNQRLDKTVRYPVQKVNTFKPGPAKHRNIKLRDTIRHEAHSVANRLLGKTDIPEVVKSEDLFNEVS